jgi:protein TonB
MFADSLYDSSWANRSWANRSHRAWTTLVSFGLQAIAMGSLFLLPLLYTSGLPRPQWMAVLVAPARATAPQPPAPRVNASRPISNLSPDGRVIAPPSIPQSIDPVTEAAPPPVDLRELGVSGGTGDRFARNGILNSIGTGIIPVVQPPPPAPRPLRISRMMEGNLIYRVQPEYPYLAKMARVQGAVVLHATISKQGAIEDLQVVSGAPMLVKAALDAVRQWRYRPYFLNDEPVEVDTQVTVNFVLSGG